MTLAWLVKAFLEQHKDGRKPWGPCILSFYNSSYICVYSLGWMHHIFFFMRPHPWSKVSTVSQTPHPVLSIFSSHTDSLTMYNDHILISPLWSISNILLLIDPLSRLRTCPNLLSLASLTSSTKFPACAALVTNPYNNHLKLHHFIYLCIISNRLDSSAKSFF